MENPFLALLNPDSGFSTEWQHKVIVQIPDASNPTRLQSCISNLVVTTQTKTLSASFVSNNRVLGSCRGFFHSFLSLFKFKEGLS
jgi:hypothetical protein